MADALAKLRVLFESAGAGTVVADTRQIDTATKQLSATERGLANAVKVVGGAFAGYSMANQIEAATLLAARNETLGVVMGVVGNNIGYTRSEVDAYARDVAKMGITVEQSRLSVTRMAQANLDLAETSSLARVAQDAAVIANMNSSQALEGIMHGITTLQPEVLRTYGIIVNFEAAYKSFAEANYTTVDALSQQQKQQIALNEVLKAGTGIHGAYEASLGTVGKALTSLKRYVDDDKAAFGELFTPALKVVVDETTATLKHLGAWFVENRADISEWGQDFASVVNVSLGAAKEGMEVFLAVAGTAPDVLGAIADNTDLVVVALTAMTGAQVVNGVGALVGSLAELKAAAVAAQGAILAANAASAAGGLAAGAAALGAGTTFALATATGGAFYMATKSAMQGIQSLTGLELDGGKAAYEEALARDAEATKRLDAAMKKRAEYEEQKKAWDGKFQVAIKQYQEQEEAQRKLESKLADERRALADAEMRDNLARTRREGELQMAALDAGYSQGLVGTRAYYDARLGIIQDAADAELAYIAQRQGEVQALLDNEKDPEGQLKLQKQLVDLQKEQSTASLALNKSQIETAREYADALENQRTEILAINDATQQSYESLLGVLGVRREIVDVLAFEYETSRQVAEIQLEIERSMGDPAKLTALQAQLDMENDLAAAKRAQLQTAMEMSLLNEQFAMEQQQIELLQKQGLEEEAFQRQQALDLLETETEYRQKMLDYQNELNTATQAGLETAATLIRQNMTMYQDLYQQTVDDINSRSFTPGAATSGAMNSGTDTTNWSGLAGTYVRTVPNYGQQWAAGIAQRIEEEQAAADAAADAWQRAREAAADMADDLSVRLLKVTGREEEATVQKLLIDQEAELKKAREAGINTTQLMAVQQLEYNKVVLDIQQEANDAATAAHEAYLKAQAEAEGRYYGTGLDLLEHMADEARQLFEDTKNQLEASLQDYSSSISGALGDINDTIRSLEQAASDLRATSSRLLGGSDSILSPEQKYLQSRLTYTTTANAAMGGDLGALQQLSGVAEAFISASRSYYASGTAYAADFNAVQSVLASAADRADALGANLDPQVDLLTRQLDVLAAIRDAIKIDNMQALQDQLGQLEANNTALATLNATTGGVGTAVTTGTSGVENAVTATVLPLTNINTGTASLGTLFDQYKTTYATKTDAAKTVLDTTATNAYNTWQQAALTAERTDSIATVATNTSPLGDIKTGTGNTAGYTKSINDKTAKLKSYEESSTVYGYTPVSGTKVPLETTTTAGKYAYYRNGGIYPGGLAVMGEEGPELVDSSPGYVYTAQETREILNKVKSSGDSAETVAELRQMNTELKEQNRQLAATVATLQAGFNELIRGNKSLDRRMEGLESKARLSAAA